MDFLNFLKSLFSKKNAANDFPKYATGVLPDPGDYRTPELGAVQANVSVPTSYKLFESNLLAVKFFNQLYLGICVPSGIFKLAQAFIFRKTGKIIPLHPRLSYKLCKQFDGIPKADGTIPRIGALCAVKFGIGTTKYLEDNVSLSMADYLNFKITPEMLADAALYKMPGFASVFANKESIKQAIFQNGAIVGTTTVGDWSKLPLLPTPYNGDHYTIWYGYEDLGNDLKIFNWNSWGEGWLAWVKNWLFPGRGYFLLSDYQNYIRDIISFTDIPPDFLTKIQKLPYMFTKELKFGMTDPSVKELQKMLNEDPDTIVALDGTGSSELETNYFGYATQGALVKWQKKHGLPGTGYFGVLSIKEANKRISTTGKITAWASAVQEYEGYAPGTRSYKNNNPGNIRYVGVFMQYASGHDAQNFCIFETYTKGFAALQMLLTRACSGLSSVYHPTDTLNQFYEKYAPTADDNVPSQYAKWIANKLGVTVDTQIKDLL